jgi:heat shock protein HslJ
VTEAGENSRVPLPESPPAGPPLHRDTGNPYLTGRGILLPPFAAVIPMQGLLIPHFAATVALAILAAGCTVPGRSPPLADTSWTLTGIRNGEGDLVPVLAGSVVTAAFSRDGRVTGSAGCNRYFARYSADGNVIAIRNAGSTKMFCGSPEGLMVQESRFLSHLAAASTIAIDGTVLTLRGSAGQPLLVFREGAAERETGSPPAL